MTKLFIKDENDLILMKLANIEIRKQLKLILEQTRLVKQNTQNSRMCETRKKHLKQLFKSKKAHSKSILMADDYNDYVSSIDNAEKRVKTTLGNKGSIN